MRISRIRWMIPAGVFILLAGLALPASTVIYRTGFEAAEGYTAGAALDGQNGWTGVGGATVTTGGGQGGSEQLVALEADSAIERTVSGSGDIWITGYYKGAGSDAAPDYPREQQAACILHFSSTGGIQALTKDATDQEIWVPADPAEAIFTSASQWTKISLHILYNDDPALARWEVFINGARYLSDLKFRDPLTALNGFRNLSGTESAFDTFEVIISDGDADGDGVSDEEEARVGTDPLTPDPGGILAFDVDGDGKVTILDGVRQVRISRGEIPLTTERLVDANGDTLTNEEDGFLIYQWAIGNPLVPFLPVR